MNFLDGSYPDTDPTKQPLLSQSPSTTAVLSQLLPPSSYQYAPPVPHPHDVTDHTAARPHSRSPESRSASFQAASSLPTGVPGAATLVNEGSPFREAPPGALFGANSETKGGPESHGTPGKGPADKEGGADGVEAGGKGGGGGGGGGEGGGFEDEIRYAPKSTRETVRAVVNKRFWQRFFGLLVLARAENSIVIVVLVAINIVVAAQVGKIPGSFILALVKRDWQVCTRSDSMSRKQGSTFIFFLCENECCQLSWYDSEICFCTGIDTPTFACRQARTFSATCPPPHTHTLPPVPLPSPPAVLARRVVRHPLVWRHLRLRRCSGVGVRVPRHQMAPVSDAGLPRRVRAWAHPVQAGAGEGS